MTSLGFCCSDGSSPAEPLNSFIHSFLER